MHSPRPYGLSVSGGELTDEDLSFIDHEVKKLTSSKTVSGLENIKHVRDLPQGGYVLLQDMGGILKAIVFKEKIEQGVEFDGFARLYVPMLYSGVITKAIVKTEEKKVGIRLTEQTRRRLAGYVKDELPAKDIESERFFIEYHPYFQYFKPQYTGIYTHTQYVRQRATWYSGAMAELMQIVGGYGKQNITELPNIAIERAQFKIPYKYIESIVNDLDGVRLPGYSGIPDIEGQFQYDYKFNNTHAVSFDHSNKPWLVQINALGVYVMPMPIIPATATSAFREYIEQVGDDEILKVLDRFGGMPSGEGFPGGSDFQAWRRAGVIIKVCDTLEFYQHYAFYIACGWSFNSKGDEAFNTCFNYLPNMLKEAYGFKLKLNLAACENHGWLKKISAIGDVNRISNYLGKLIALLPKGTTKTHAILYKLRRVPQDDIYQRALTSLYDPLGVTSNDVDYWDNLELDPIAAHTGSLSQVSRGHLYHPGFNPAADASGGLKFPELTGQGCESFQLIEPEYKGGVVKCDTVVFGCYVNDALKVIKYFYDERQFIKEEQSTFEDIMIVGSWDKTTTTGLTGLMGKFYTSDFDDRQEASEVTTYTKITGRDLGYGNPAYQTPYVLFTHGSLGRARYYTHLTQTNTSTHFSLESAVCIPVFNRDAFLYAYQDSIGGESESEKLEKKSIADPTSYPLWTYDPIFHWIGGHGKGEPKPKTGEYVYVYGPPNYTPNAYSDFADSGDWFGVGSSYVDVSGVCAPYTSRTSSTHNAAGVVIGGESPQVETYEKNKSISGKTKGHVNICYAVSGARAVHKNNPEAWYFAFSPVDAGSTPHYFYRDACKVVFGDSEYANISETDQYNRRYKWGYTSLVDYKSAYNFIGVINE